MSIVHVRTPQGPEHAREHRRVHGLQERDRPHRERAEPATHGPCGRHHCHPREAAHQRVALDEAKVPQAAAPDHEQGHEQTNHRDHAVVAPRGDRTARLAHECIEPNRPQVAAEQLKAGVRRQRDVREFKGEISIDAGPQIGSALSHRGWPVVVG
jgi:hypothetical protein